DLGNDGEITFSDKVSKEMRDWITSRPNATAMRNAAIEKYGAEIYPVMFEYLSVAGSLGSYGKDLVLDDTVLPPGLKAWILKKGETAKTLRDQHFKDHDIALVQGNLEKDETFKKRVHDAQRKAIAKVEPAVPLKILAVMNKAAPGYKQAEAALEGYV